MISFPSPGPEKTASFLLRAGGSSLAPGPEDYRLELAHTPLRIFAGPIEPGGLLLVVLRGHVDAIADALGPDDLTVTEATLPDGDLVRIVRVTDPVGVPLTFVGVGERARFFKRVGADLQAPMPVRAVAVRRFLETLDDKPVDPAAATADPARRVSDAFVAAAPVLHVALARDIIAGTLDHDGVDFLPPASWTPGPAGLTHVGHGPPWRVAPGADASVRPRLYADVLHNDLHVDLVADSEADLLLRVSRDPHAWRAFWATFTGQRAGTPVRTRLYLGVLDGIAPVEDALNLSAWMCPTPLHQGSAAGITDPDDQWRCTFRSRFSGALVTVYAERRLAIGPYHPAMLVVDAVPDPWSAATVPRIRTPLERPLPDTLPIDVAAVFARSPLLTIADVAEVVDACPDDPDDDELALQHVWAWLQFHEDHDDALRALVGHERASVRWAAWRVGHHLGLTATTELAHAEADPTLRRRMGVP